jgi:acyl dehydratase
MTKLYWEDFEVGQVSVYGDRYVGADEIKEFAAQFDPQPMHLDEEAARATLVGGLCASGWHTCAIMMRIIADGFVLNSSSMGAPGVEEVRWLAPVRPGDTLRVRTTVLDKRVSRSRPQLGFVDLSFEVLNDAGTCVMTSRTNMMFGRRQPVAEVSA